ncbi:hypothetical protein [Micromonospora humida]|uniref:hypothetical protein n=1 Tax=Micromonospora humida TaxID=2809018 RepID=UPI0033EAE698
MNHYKATLIGLDIEGFQRHDRDDHTRLDLRRRLYAILTKTLACIQADHHAELLDRGDGIIAVLRGPMTAPTALRNLIPCLARELELSNADVAAPNVMRLRAVLHSGEVIGDEHGYIGSDLNLVFRILDAAALRDHLSHSDAPLVLALSDHVWRESHQGDPATQSFTEVSVQVKETSTHAWVASFGTDPHRGPKEEPAER